MICIEFVYYFGIGHQLFKLSGKFTVIFAIPENFCILLRTKIWFVSPFIIVAFKLHEDL